jgi:hypothetical protein
MKSIRVIAGVTLAGVLAAASPALGQTDQLKSTAEILGALKAGQPVRVVLHYKDMALVDDKGQPDKAPDATGGMTLDTWEYFAAGAVGNPEGYLAASHTQLIRHPRHGYVLNYVKLSVYDGGTVKIVAQYLSPATYEVRMDETFTTQVASDAKKGAAVFHAGR